MVYRSGSTLAASFAFVHRYPSGDFESLPVSSSECHQLHPPYVPNLYNITFSQLAPSHVSLPPQMFPSCSLGTRTRPAPHYWPFSSSFTSWLYTLTSRVTTIAILVRANASTQSSQKLVSSHLYHRLHLKNGTLYSGFTLLLHLRLSHAARRGLCKDATNVIVRTGICSLDQIPRELWRTYGRIRRRNSDWSGAVDNDKR